MDIKKLVKPDIQSLCSYQVKEIPCKVKLDANESPYGFKTFKSIRSNRYPDPEAKTLKKLTAKKFNVKPENILAGNGSDELIYYLITTFGGPVLYPIPTFSMYGIISQALGENKIEIPLDKKFDLDMKNFLKTIRKQKPKLVFLSSPNNPTGNCFSSDRIQKIIKESNGLIVVDEAYQPFSGRNEFMPVLSKYKNLVILRSLSKIGLAGLRVGFMIANKEIINQVNKVRLPFNLNSISQKLAAEALKNKKQMNSSIRSIISERKRLLKEMEKLDGVRPYPSNANFILFKTKDANKIFKKLLKKGVLIRNMTDTVDECLRVTIGTPRENNTFLKALGQLL